MDNLPYTARFVAMNWESSTPKVRQKLHRVGDQQLRVVEFERGLEHPAWCERGHIGYILQGKLALEFDEETLEFGEGEGFIIPDGKANRHRPVPLTEHVLLILSERVS